MLSDSAREANELQQVVFDLRPWFHNLHLPDGSETAPEHALGDFPAYKWREIGPCLPVDLSGWEVLDIGCNAGFYSFELARRGAQVTGIDVSPHYLAQARWAAGLYGLESRVDFRQMQVYDLAGCQEKFDLVLFLGVFYHLRYPLLGLDIVSRLVDRLLIFQTMTLPGEAVCATGDPGIYDRLPLCDKGWPKLAFIEERLAEDPTNWWVANHAGAMALLRSSGFRVMERPGDEIYLCEPDPEHPSCISSWNRSEFESATGRRLS